MPRRWISTLLAIAAVAALALVLYNATLVDRRPPTLSRVTLSATAGDDDHVAQTLTAIDLVVQRAGRPDVGRAALPDRALRRRHVHLGSRHDGRSSRRPGSSRRRPRSASTVAAGYADLAGNAAPDATGPFQFQTVGPPVVATMDPASGTGGRGHGRHDPARVRSADGHRLGRGRAGGRPGRAVPGELERAEPDDRVRPSRSPSARPTPSTSAATPPTPTGATSRRRTPARSRPSPRVSASTPSSRPTAWPGSRSGPRSRSSSTARSIPRRSTEPSGSRRRSAGTSASRACRREAPTGPGSTDANGSPIPPPTSPPPAGTVLLFSPSSPLAQHTTYTVELAPIVKRAGDPGQVAAGRTWTFTTGGQATSAQNQIAFLSARGGVRNVWLMNPDGSNPREVTAELAPVSAFDVASDGRSIVYAADGAVRLLRLDGSDPTTVTSADDLEYAPTIVPGGGAVLVGRRDRSWADLGWWIEPLPGAPPARRASSSRTARRRPARRTSAGTGSSPGPASRPGPPGRASTRRAAGSCSSWPTAGSSTSTCPRTRRFPAPSRWPSRCRAASRPGTVPPTRSSSSRRPAAATASSGSRWTGAHRPALFPAVGPAAVSESGGIVALVAPIGDHLGFTATPPRALDALTSTPELVDRFPGFSPDGTTVLFGRVPTAEQTRSAGYLAGRSRRARPAPVVDRRRLPALAPLTALAAAYPRPPTGFDPALGRLIHSPAA